MASQSNLLGLGSCIPPLSPTPTPFNSHNNFSCLWNDGAKYKRVNSLSLVRPICNAISKSRTQEYYKEVFENGLPVIKWDEIVDGDTLQDIEVNKVFLSDGIKERVDSIRLMLDSMEDGEISVSPYDTAWVALVEHVNNKNNNGRRVPQFPSSLQWIANHQLSDGSWGDNLIFSAHDRIINTLACVVALKSWNIFPEKCEKGMVFIRENICKLKDENDEHMPIGFEIAFPSLIEIAQKIDIEIPHDSPFMKEIYAKRDLKLERIPKEIFHKVPTTLLHSMEGMEGLEWEKLLKLQSKDGSFLFSPSSTAFALSQTQDENCLSYLKQIVHKFNGGVPNVYPVDLFEHIWAIDRLQRLGVSRYFQAEINECLDYVHRYWSEEGICWARNSKVIDIDDTAMGFRLLRLHGYDVSPNVFRHLKKGDGFVCFVGQSTQAVTGMYNLYRASQMKFPGEEILEEANKFSYKFLREKQACNELLDKWIITKDLPGEVGYALDVPWYASLPRVETRFYIEQYGGEDDVWIGKTLYRMPYVNNNNYLELAKLDFNDCQAHHQLEWHNIQKWYTDANLEKFGISKRTLLFAYFVASSSIFESEKSEQRLAWAKTSVLIEAIASYFNNEMTSNEHKRAFINEFESNSSSTRDYLINGRRSLSNPNKFDGGLIETLLRTLNQLSLDALVVHGRDIRYHLCLSWGKWLRTLDEEEDRYEGEAELLVQTINHCGGGPFVSEEPLLSHPQYLRLSQLTNTVCHQLRYFQKYKEYSNGSYKAVNENENMTTPEIELCMQELAQLVLQSSPDDIDADIKQTFLTVAKSFYYAAYCNPGTINFHISKVLFEKVD